MKNYFAYIRVSTQRQGQSGVSLHEQRDSIAAFAKRNSLHISQWFEDRETAAKVGRTQFVRMMTTLERGRVAGVILHKIDRGARNHWDWARIGDLIDNGIEVHFVHDNLDLTSRGGRLAADIQAVVAADYIRNLRDEVRKGVRGRLKQGLYPWKAPAGYLDCGGGKPKVIDPVKGPLVRLAFDLYASKQYSYDRLVRELHERGLRGANGKMLSLKGLTTILRNPFYIGIIRLKRSGEVFQGVHEPLIEARLFERIQAIIDGRLTVKMCKHDFIYRRLLTCGSCHRQLIGELQKGRVYYRCQTPSCSTTSVREDKVKVAFRQLVRAFPVRVADYQELLPYIEAEAKTEAQRQGELLTSLKLRIASLEDRDRRLTDAYLDQAIDRDTYNVRKADLLTQLAQARGDLKHAEDPSSADFRQLAKDFLELLRTLEIGPESGFLSEYRACVEKLTSNRVLMGKKLELTTSFPFQVSPIGPTLSLSGPHRHTTRTLDGLGNAKRTRARHGRSDRSSHIVLQPTKKRREVQAELLLKYLKESGIAEQLGPITPPPRKPNPGWFERKPLANDSDELMAA